MTQVIARIASFGSSSQSTTSRSYDTTLHSTSSIDAANARSTDDHSAVDGATAASSASRWRWLAAATVGSRGVRGAIGNDDTYSKIRVVTSATSSRRSPSTSTPASSSSRAHHRVAQLALAGEVPVDGPFVDAGALGDGADGQRAPVPDREAVEQLGAGDEDALARLRRALAAYRAVVPATWSCRGDAHGRTTGSVSHPRTVDVGASRAPSQSTSHSGKRASTSSSATRPSRRASAAPRQ